MQKIADETGGKYYKALESKDIVDIFAKFGYMDDFDMTDTDGDGLPDAVETAGIRLQNGIILRDVDSSGLIFTDPTNPDTDGDGLLDGEEIDPTPCVKTVPVIERDPSFCGPVLTQSSYYFKANSDPRKVGIVIHLTKVVVAVVLPLQIYWLIWQKQMQNIRHYTHINHLTKKILFLL